MQEDAILGIFCCPSLPCSLKNCRNCYTAGAAWTCNLFQSLSVRHLVLPTISAASSSLLTYFLRGGDQNWQHWKQMGTPMFHKASQSFYTQEQVTSNLSYPILSSPLTLSGPLLMCSAAKANQANIFRSSPGSPFHLQVPVLSTTSHTKGLDEPTHMPIHVSHTYFSKTQKFL